MAMEKCAVCGGNATATNKDGFPICSRCRDKKVKMPLCPDCGAPMALRKGKFGSFWGCNMYPNCMGTKKLGEK